jgi:hypothetical protein
MATRLLQNGSALPQMCSKSCARAVYRSRHGCCAGLQKLAGSAWSKCASCSETGDRSPDRPLCLGRLRQTSATVKACCAALGSLRGVFSQGDTGLRLSNVCTCKRHFLQRTQHGSGENVESLDGSGQEKHARVCHSTVREEIRRRFLVTKLAVTGYLKGSSFERE